MCNIPNVNTFIFSCFDQCQKATLWEPGPDTGLIGPLLNHPLLAVTFLVVVLTSIIIISLRETWSSSCLGHLHRIFHTPIKTVWALLLCDRKPEVGRRGLCCFNNLIRCNNSYPTATVHRILLSKWAKTLVFYRHSIVTVWRTVSYVY